MNKNKNNKNNEIKIGKKVRDFCGHFRHGQRDRETHIHTERQKIALI